MPFVLFSKCRAIVYHVWAVAALAPVSVRTCSPDGWGSAPVVQLLPTQMLNGSRAPVLSSAHTLACIQGYKAVSREVLCAYSPAALSSASLVPVCVHIPLPALLAPLCAYSPTAPTALLPLHPGSLLRVLILVFLSLLS